MADLKSNPIIPRHLVTTSDERSWKKDQPLLFLGEWCRLYDRAQYWSGLDAIVATPFNFAIEQKKVHIEYVQELSRILLGELTITFNKLHEVNHSQRYWDILLGYWLQRYVAVTFNRYFTIKNVIEQYKIKSTTVLALEDYSLATDDSINFLYACNSPLWNHFFYKDVLKYLGGCEFEYLSLDDDKIDNFRFHANGFQSNRKSFYKQARHVISRLLLSFKNNNDAYIFNTYLPRWQEAKLNLYFGQCPQLWESPSLQFTPLNKDLRHHFRINTDGYTGFENFVRCQLPKIIPICYLEGYSKLCNQADSLTWPTKPKFIFTSTSFDTDEIFKAWTAKKTEQKVPYFVGQHGNHYGTHIYIGNDKWPLRQSADNFLTWGWQNEKTKDIPSFIFKTAGKKKRNRSLNGGLLLIEVYQPHMCDPIDTYYEHGVYYKEQLEFVNALPAKIKRKLTVRLHNSWHLTTWSDGKRWADFDSSIHIDSGILPVEKLTAQSRLVVHSYDSTGILETLSLNIPTLCFWHGGLDHLLPVAKPYYELLRDVGIIADTPKQAAQFVALNWGDIDKWWGSEEVQRVRKIFCNQYARSENDPVTTLKAILCKARNNFTGQIKNA